MGHPGAEPVAQRQRQIEGDIFPGVGAAVAIVIALDPRPQAERAKGAAVDRLIVIRGVVMAVVAAIIVVADAERPQLRPQRVQVEGAADRPVVGIAAPQLIANAGSLLVNPH